jgi:hypothetical protein
MHKTGTLGQKRASNEGLSFQLHHKANRINAGFTIEMRSPPF